MSKNLYKNKIGQLEASIEEIEPILDDEEFKDFCDAVYSCITYFRVAIKRTKSK